jgi:hypothetical protein
MNMRTYVKWVRAGLCVALVCAMKRMVLQWAQGTVNCRGRRLDG